METESGAKIAIRGKGSVKEGKGRSDAAHSSNQEEDLHCLVMADNEDKINKAKQLIHNVIETVRLTPLWPRSFASTNKSQAASTPENQNELKRNQLRELAALNGTLRDDENQACQNCGKIGHRKYDCPEKQNFTASIICRVCGNAGHMARDCPDRQRGASWRNDGARPAAGRVGAGDGIDREYEVSFFSNCTTNTDRLTGCSNSCKNSAVALALLLASKPVPAVATKAMPSHGSAEQLEALRLGDPDVMTETLVPAPAPQAVLHPGRVIATVDKIIKATAGTMEVVVARAVRLPGSSSNPLPDMANLMQVTEAMLAMLDMVAVATELHLAWLHLPECPRLNLVVMRPRDSLALIR